MRSRGATLTLFPLAVTALLMAGFLLTPGLRVPGVPTPHPTVVVLGAAQYAGHPSPAFRRRLDHALALYRAGHVRHVVVTGGRRPGDPYTEGGVGTTYLQEHGVPRAALSAETRSRTTIENLQNARVTLPPRTPVTLVTDEAHAPRALALARALGMNANVSASPLSPHVSRTYLLREKLALFGYALLGLGL
ncbi:YdcF family protein [Deinococcus taeanensis]|uniref:YdcF family protein n=1 Tax=Deinococcus taeanensis TaxID=2737050 RepID=UPI001CDBF54C|nr:YdcF family protein [Deinococcus taeanensis]UBV41952.1 YdcF family protein [Deinococcus taeanensis]